MSTNKSERLVSPRGVLIWPKLNTPDQYKENGKPKGDLKYKTGLKLAGAGAQSLIDILTEAQDTAYQEAMAAYDRAFAAMTPAQKAKAKAPVKADLPMKPVFNDQGELTGETLFDFSQKAFLETKSGERIDKKPAFFDSKRRPVTPLDLSSGSEARLSYSVSAFTNAKGETFVTMRPSAVMLYKVVQFGSGGGDEFAGFEEDGFEGTEAPSKGVDTIDMEAGDSDGSSLL